MLDENAPRRTRGQAVRDLASEDLDLYAVEELRERIADLQAEIDRTQAKLDRKQQGKAAGATGSGIHVATVTGSAAEAGGTGSRSLRLTTAVCPD